MSRKSHPRPHRLRIARALIASGIRAERSAPSAGIPHAWFSAGSIRTGRASAPRPGHRLVLLDALPGGFHAQSAGKAF